MTLLRSPRRTLLHLAAALLPSLALPAMAQISLSTAVDLALHSSSRVQVALADVARARAAVQEQEDVYIPNLTAGGTGYGKSYGFPLGQPTVVSLQSSSLVFNYSQHDYIRAVRASYDAAVLSLLEARQVVAEDTVVTYMALEHDAARDAALREQRSFAEKLVSIVQIRLDAGQDTPIGLTTAQMTAAQIRLALLRTEDDAAVDAAHLSHLTGIPDEDIRVLAGSVPPIPTPDLKDSALGAATSPGIDAVFANSRAKRQLAFGDARYLLRPQISFGAQYSRLSTFNNDNYQQYYGRRDQFGNILPFQLNTVGVGVQLSVPVLDYAHRAKARESAAEAVRAEHDADTQRDLFTEGRLRLQRSTVELAARAEIAELDQRLAQQQLEVIEIQLNAPSATPITPKEEQNQHIAEREKYLTLLDARFQIRQAQVSLLRQTGGLDRWLRTVALAPAAPSLSGSIHP